MSRVEDPRDTGPDEQSAGPTDPTTPPEQSPDAGPPPGAGTPGRVALAILAYVGARLLLLAVLAGVLVLVGLPTVVALLLGVIIALPLSLVLFRGLRTRLAVEIEAATAERRERRQRLRAELRGD